jgi:hypothetical protein
MTYQDADFGIVTVTVNPRARSIIMRPEVGGLRVTAFRGASLAFVKSTIDKFRSSLLGKQKALKERPQLTAEDVERMRQEAKDTLPRRVAELAYMHGFHYAGLTIRDSKTRWGSCSGRNTISLSLYLMQVPEHLQDYVILHELCHTVHHNHSPRFWALMDTVTDGKAHALRRELHQYHTR